jgi:hypothetical protein
MKKFHLQNKNKLGGPGILQIAVKGLDKWIGDCNGMILFISLKMVNGLNGPTQSVK